MRNLDVGIGEYPCHINAAGDHRGAARPHKTFSSWHVKECANARATLPYAPGFEELEARQTADRAVEPFPAEEPNGCEPGCNRSLGCPRQSNAS